MQRDALLMDKNTIFGPIPVWDDDNDPNHLIPFEDGQAQCRR